MPQVYVTSLIDVQSLWSHLVSTFARIKAGGAFLVANTMMFIKFCLYTHTHFLLVSVHTTSTNMFLYTHFLLGSDGFHLLINTTVDCLPSLNFQLRSKTYLKECPPNASIANRDYPLSSKPEDVVRLVYTHYKVLIILLYSGLH